VKRENAVKSMTGFGEARFSDGAADYRFCISSVNHKFLDISVRLPDEMSLLEPWIKSAIRAGLGRGRVSVSAEKSGGEHAEIRVNCKAAAGYIKSLKELSRKFSLKEEISPVELMKLPGVVTVEKPDTPAAALQDKVKPALKRAMSDFILSREEEGEKLGQAMKRSAARVSKLSASIEKRAGVSSRKKSAVLKKKIKEAGLNPSEGGFASEIANIVNRLDIEEEIVRLNSHIEQFSEALESKPSGVRLEFILQEILRESNTIAAKSQDLTITKKIIEIKTELQRLKEQVQNVE
jgi:uncharacterized protein (TIGR00255 family)